MVIYIILLSYLALFAFLVAMACDCTVSFKTPCHAKFTFSASFLVALYCSLIVSLILGLRYNVGTDFASYREIYESFEMGRPKLNEPAYNLLNAFVIVTGFGFWLVLFISAFLAFVPIFYRIYKDSKSPWLSVLIIFGLSIIFQSTNHVRFLFVVSAIFFAARFIADRNWFRWFLTVIAASMFHYAGLLYAPLYFIAHRRIPPLLLVLTMVIAIFMMMSVDVSMKFLMLIDPVIPEIYNHYVLGYALNYIEKQELGYGSLIYIFMFLFFFILTYLRKFSSKVEIVYANFAMVGYVLLVAFYNFGSVGRLAGPLIATIALLIPQAIEKFRPSSSRYVVTVFFIAMFSGLFILGLVQGSHDAVPYSSILFKG